MECASEFVHRAATVGCRHNTGSDRLPSPVLILDDDLHSQWRLRDALRSLGYEDAELVLANSVAQAGAWLADEDFGLALIDIGLPDGSGIDVIRQLRQRDPEMPVLVVSMWNTAPTVVTALQAGAVGYVLKERETAEIAQAVRSALIGGAPIDPFVARHILELVGDRQAETGISLPKPLEPGAALLSARELEILGLVSKGLTNREIADVLKLSKLTIGCHIRNIYKKLDVSSRTQAVFEARSFGWLS